MTVWSVCPLFTELDLLEVRLRELDEVVDVHVIAESPHTFRGDEKPLLFDPVRFGPWLHKIRYLVTDRMEGSPHQGFGERDRWARENGQRAALAEGLTDVAPYDVVILSDLDEIPRASLVEGYIERRLESVVCPELPMHLYRVGLRIVERQASVLRLFRGSQLSPARTPEYMRHRPAVPPPWRQAGPAPFGWHLSYFGGVDAVRYKVAQAAHPEEDVPAWVDPDHLAWCITVGHDHRGNRIHTIDHVVPDAQNVPRCIAEDPDRFRTLIDPLVWPAEYPGASANASDPGA